MYCFSLRIANGKAAACQGHNTLLLPLGVMVLGVMLALLLLSPKHLLAEESSPPVDKVIRLVTLLTEDEEGNKLSFPSAVAFDRDMEEIYVVNGGKGGIVIYDTDFFPHLFLGPGRGIDAPQSVFFDKTGRIYVCQGRSANRPPRLTILNAAFFVEREFTFEQLPEERDFSPMRGVIGPNGAIYLVGANTRGVAVFNKEGQFLRWLRPLDRVRIQAPAAENADTTNEASPSPTTAELKTALADNDTQTPPVGNAPQPPPSEEGALPQELQPKTKKAMPEAENAPELNPVLAASITTDSDGHLFVLSEETSKIYVYGADETLLFSFGQKGGSTGKMSRPRGIAIDEEKKSIYVLDYMRHAILVYDFGGGYMTEFGGRGSGPLWFNFPSDLAIDRKGRLMIADLFNNRIQILKPEFTTSFPKYQGVKSQQPGNTDPKEKTPTPSEP